MTTGDVEITILDGGAAIVVPGAEVQVVIGTSSAGTAAQIIATQNPNTLVSNLGYGNLPEAAALSALAGGTILGLKAATITAGSIRKKAAVAITSSTNASPIVVTTPTHGLMTGDIVTIASHLVNTGANGTWQIIVLSATTFSLTGSTGTGVGGATGTVTPDGVVQIGTGTSEITVTGTPNDDYFLKVLITNGGTIGTTGITFRLSLDAGRNYGPTLSLGTATTYVITNTGLTLNFSAGTLVTDDYATCGTIAPQSDTGSIIDCLEALVASPYGITGWGSMHITGIFSGADADTINSQLDTMAGQFMFTRMILSARDASPPAIYGGTAENEATWLAALQSSYSAVDAKRLCANGGHYNMPSAYPNPLAGSPRYRRPLGWALAPRQVTIPPQRHAGRVRDGSLSNIVVDPTLDPNDGFIYHDERQNPGLDAARFSSARTRIKLPGFYIVNPKLMSPLGSVFTLLPLGNVMDIACGIVHQVGQQDINSDVRLNTNGTIYENEALAIEQNMYGQIKVQMIDTSEISSATVTVNRSWNVLSTSIVKISVTITARGYILQEDVEIGFQNPFAAGAA